MYRSELHNTVDLPWTLIEPIRVGPVPIGTGTPGIYITVERNGTPFARIDAWPLREGPFTEVLSWKHYVVVGWNDRAHLVDPLAGDVRSIECDGYFGSVYPFADLLLVATASRLICVNDCRDVVWESDQLGIDGVVVDEIQDGEIGGQGDWDPPGGWKSFRLLIGNGQMIVK